MTFSTTVIVTLTPVPCANCGCHFGIDETMRQRRLDDHKTFYCPSGHTNFYNSESEAEKLKREKQSLQNSLRYAEMRAESATRKLTTAKGQFTKYRNRVAKGICPCCNDTFPDVAAHMASQHPDEVARQDTEYIEPDKEIEKAVATTQTKAASYRVLCRRGCNKSFVKSRTRNTHERKYHLKVKS